MRKPKPLSEQIIACVGRHDFDKAEKLIKSAKRRTQEIKIAELHLRVTRSRKFDIEEGLEIVSQHPRAHKFLIWKETLLKQQETLLRLEGKDKEANTVRNKRLTALVLLSGSRTIKEEAEAIRWNFQLATAHGHKMNDSEVHHALGVVERMTKTTTSPELTYLADYALAFNEVHLAQKLLEAQPYRKAKDGKKKDWTTESKHLTPYNRRGFGLEILVSGQTPEKLLRQKFAASQRLGCMNELRSLAWMLLQLPVDGAKKLGEEFQRELV